MLLSLAKLSVYGFNRTSLTIEDFYKICETENIQVIHENIASSFYMAVDGKKFIVLSRFMSTLKQLFVAYHELHHAMLGPEEQTRACFFGLDDTPEERTANAFAAIAIIPRHEIGTTDIDNSKIGQVIYEQRVNIFKTYGI